MEIYKLVEFLAPFRDVTDELQARKVPTLHMVIVRLHDMKEEHCKPSDDDSPDLRAIKERCVSLLDTKVQLHTLHYVAAFLCPNPNIRLLRNLPSEKRAEVHATLRQMCTEAKAPITSGDAEEVSDAGPPSKKSRFGGWSQGDDGEGESMDEVDLYLATGRAKSEDPTDLLKWWQARENIFPKLAAVARRVLSIPATSASSERNFSRAGLIVTDKRSSIVPENVNDLPIIHNNYQEEDLELRVNRDDP